MMLPSAVASAGPAITGSPDRSAVIWHSSSFATRRRRCGSPRCRPWGGGGGGGWGGGGGGGGGGEREGEREGEVRGSRLSRKHRPRQLQPDERPCPARDVREPRPSRWHPHHCRRRIVRRHRCHRDAVMPAPRRTRLFDRRQHRQRDPHPPQQRSRPRSRSDVDQPGRRRVGVLGAELAGQPEREQVGEQRDVRRREPNGSSRCSAASW